MPAPVPRVICNVCHRSRIPRNVDSSGTCKFCRPDSSKVCSSCGRVRLMSEFPWPPSTPSPIPKCRECTNGYLRSNVKNTAAYPFYRRNSNGRRRAREHGAECGTVTLVDMARIWERQGRQCAACGNTHPSRSLDHVVPLSAGGGHVVDNIQWLCTSCNRLKRDHPMEWLMEALKEDALRRSLSRPLPPPEERLLVAILGTTIPEATTSAEWYVKREKWASQGGRCAGCGDSHPHMEWDHIIPRVLGGSSDAENMQWLCGSCNHLKAHHSMAYLITALENEAKEWTYLEGITDSLCANLRAPASLIE